MLKKDYSLNTELKMCIDKITESVPAKPYDPEGYKKVMSQLGFVKKMKSYDECVKTATERNIDLRIAVYEWYKHITKKRVAELFQEVAPDLAQAMPYDENKSFINDIRINGMPFHLRFVDFRTVFKDSWCATYFRSPDILVDSAYYLFKYDNKYLRNVLAKHNLTEAQFENMPENLNVIYIICDEPKWKDNLELRSDFDLIKQHIAERMQEYRDYYSGDVSAYKFGNQIVYTDVIFIKKEKGEKYE